MDPQTLQALEQAHQRILTLVTTLDRLRTSLERSDELPQWSSLSRQTQIISQNIAALSTTLASTSAILDQTVGYPLQSFPGQTQPGVLEHLLNTKPSAEATVWLQSHAQTGGGRKDITQTGSDGAGPVSPRSLTAVLSGAELKELWNRAGPSVAEEASRRFAGEDLSDQDIEFEGMPTARSPR